MKKESPCSKCYYDGPYERKLNVWCVYCDHYKVKEDEEDDD